MTNDHRNFWPLRPALFLMRSMSVPSRLALIGATSLLPMTALLVALQLGAAPAAISAVALIAMALTA